MKIIKKALVTWSGGLKDGRGTLTTESGALTDQAYGFKNRFEGVKGTNPEELIGAAHAGCFTMALSGVLEKSNFTAERMDTQAQVTLEEKGGGYEITAIHLILRAKVPGVSRTQFEEMATQAKSNCPVSKLLKANITLEATLD